MEQGNCYNLGSGKAVIIQLLSYDAGGHVCCHDLTFLLVYNARKFDFGSILEIARFFPPSAMFGGCYLAVMYVRCNRK